MIYNDHPMTQREFIRKFSEQKREEFNPYFFERENQDIFREVERIIKSCERDQYFSIHVISFREITGYQEVRDALYQHEEERRAMKRKPPKTPNMNGFINIDDSDIMVLEIIYALRINGEKPEEDTLKVLLELPRFVDKYYYRLAGKLYAPVFQIVDRSTYNNSTNDDSSNSVRKSETNTLRTQFMTIRILRKIVQMTDFLSGEILDCTVYDAYIFTKTTRAMKYLLAAYGMYGCLEFLGIQNEVFITTTPDVNPDNYCFCKADIYISTPKTIFKNSIVQSFIVTVIESIKEPLPSTKTTKKNRKTDYNELFDPRFWLVTLSASFKDRDTSVEKGIAILNSMENIYDITSRDIILLPDEDKRTIYHALRWLLREFNRIHNKDNLDITFKRVRMAEPIGSLVAIKLSKGIYRISDEGKHVTMKQLKSAIYMKPDYILTVLNSSKLANFQDLVNDNDAITALSYTFKGISGLGEEGQVQNAYRRLHPSHIGRFDLDSSSASDPGLTGVLCPYGTIYKNGLFSDIPEPNFWEKEYHEMVENYNKLVGKKEVIEFKKKQGFEYDKVKDEILRESIENIRQLIVPVSDINGIIDYTNPIADNLEMD